MTIVDPKVRERMRRVRTRGDAVTGGGAYCGCGRLHAITVFSGVECFGHAAELAGIHVAAACEIDPAARGVIRHHYPDRTIYTDITELTASALAADGHLRPDGRGGWTGIDMVIGGWPCQDLSVAGNRAGLAGSRSGLWWELLRVVDAVRPRWVIGENVPGLLSSNNGRDMGTVVGSLGDLGYGLAWRVLDAQFFGVPQRRRRVFIVANSGDWTAPAEVLLEPEGSDRDPAARGETWPGTTSCSAFGVDEPREVVGTLQAHHGRNDAHSAGGGISLPRTDSGERVER